jgi:RHS repeat-associated protein
VTDRYDYDAFGNILSQVGGTSNVYLYSGEQNDPNLGFYYLRARYLNQVSGRFLSMDSVDGDFTDPRSLDRFSYVSNDPVDTTDPSGNFGLPDVVAFNLMADFGLINPSVQAGVNSVLSSFITPHGSPLSSPWTITSAFAPIRINPVNGKLRPHNGIDLIKEDANGANITFGQPVLATGDGQVESAGTCPGFGNLIIIAHTLKPNALGSPCQGGSGPFRYETWYAHNLYFNVAPWSFVHKGDTIAFADSTGTVTRPHVHYEIHDFGVPIDPLPFLF